MSLHLACQSGNECIASFLIENGSDINAKDMLKMTPVLWYFCIFLRIFIKRNFEFLFALKGVLKENMKI
jgi:hypothetical protein